MARPENAPGPTHCELAESERATTLHPMSEIIFEVHEDETDGGYVATALGHGIATQAETLDELRAMVREAVQCHFGDGAPGPLPKVIRLHYVRDEVLAV